MFGQLREKMRSLRPVAGVVEVGLAVFPLFVVGLATASFLFGGVCAPWQFTVALLGALGLLLALPGRVWRARLWGALGFLLFLGIVWALAGCFAANGADNSSYHLPVTRLLMMGWNPVLDSTPTQLVARGMPLGGMWHWHVLFIAHPVEVFNAVFGFFTRTPLDLTFPLSAFLLPMTLGAVWRMARGLGWGLGARAAALAALTGELVALGQGVEGAVDAVVGLSGVGLLATMARVLRGERRWAPLLFFSFWMMVAKQSSLLTCFVFWVGFALAALWRFRGAWKAWVLRLACWGVLLVGALCWVCATPYLTSWARFGHPLYPAYTADAERFPTHDITGDFHNRNEDARQMGHVGHLFNAYVSPTLARKWYAWRLKKPGFMPACEVWKQGSPRNDGTGAPTTPVERGLFVGSLGILLLFADRRLLPPILLCLAGLFCFPTQYIGYLRYVPWVALLPCLAAGALCAWLARRVVGHRWFPLGVCAALIVGGLGKAAFCLCIPIDSAWEAHRFLNAPGFTALIPELPEHANNLRLLCRQEPRLKGAEVLPSKSVVPGSHRLALPHFHVVPRAGDALPRPSLYKAASSLPTRAQRYHAYLLFVPRTLCDTFPRLLWARLRELC